MRPADLVFVDESGANKALCPRYGYAPKGQRCHGQAPRNRGRNTSLLDRAPMVEQTRAFFAAGRDRYEREFGG